MINLKKINRKSASPPLIFQTPHSPEEVFKIYPPPSPKKKKKEGGGSKLCKTYSYQNSEGANSSEKVHNASGKVFTDFLLLYIGDITMFSADLMPNREIILSW